MKTCPNCGIQGNWAFCPECGTAMIEDKATGICPKCGTKSNTAYCPECGTKIQSANEQSDLEYKPDHSSGFVLKSNSIKEAKSDTEENKETADDSISAGNDKKLDSQGDVDRIIPGKNKISGLHDTDLGTVDSAQAEQFSKSTETYSKNYAEANMEACGSVEELPDEGKKEFFDAESETLYTTLDEGIEGGLVDSARILESVDNNKENEGVVDDGCDRIEESDEESTTDKVKDSLEKPIMMDHDIDEPDEATIRDKSGFSNTRKQKLLRPKVIVPIIIVMVLVFGGVGIYKATNSDNAVLKMQISKTKETTVAGLKGRIPSAWKPEEDSDGVSYVHLDGYNKSGEWLAEEGIYFAGSTPTSFNEVAMKLLGIEDLTDVEAEEFKIQNCSGHYYEYSLVDKKDQDYTAYVALIDVDGCEIGFLYYTKSELYNREQAIQLLDYFQFDQFTSPKIVSISATYSGNDSGGIMIDDKCEDISVSCVYDYGGESSNVSGWTVTNPGETKWGTTNTYTIQYEGAKTELDIVTKKSFGQVAKSIKKKVKKSKYAKNGLFSKCTFDYDTEDEDFFAIILTLTNDNYTLLTYAQTGSEIGLAYEEMLLGMRGYCSNLADEFEAEGYSDVLVSMMVANPNNGKAFSSVNNEEIRINPFA